jgi:hypothetical protein
MAAIKMLDELSEKELESWKLTYEKLQKKIISMKKIKQTN